MKQYKLLLLALILVGTLLSSFHHHDDGHLNENCLTCIVGSFFSDGSLPSTSLFEGITLLFLIPLLHRSVYISTLATRTCSSRAPPPFS